MSTNFNLNIYIDQSLQQIIPLEYGFYDLGKQNEASDINKSIELWYPTVSSRHGQLRIEEKGIFYQDKGSRNGSYFTQEYASEKIRLKTGEDLPLAPSTILYIGPFNLRIKNREQSPQIELEKKLENLSELYLSYLSENHSHTFEAFVLLHKHLFEETPELKDRLYSEFNLNGPIECYLANSDCKEILINSHKEIFIEDAKELRLIPDRFISERTFEAWAKRMAIHAGARLDLAQPICETTLACGARFQAVLPPLSKKGLSVSIRRYNGAITDEGAAISSGWMEVQALEILKKAVQNKKNILISGGTSTGKTTLLNFLTQYIGKNERLVTVEDTPELKIPIPNFISLLTRKSNADGIGEVSIRKLIECALRMRPDRIIVGECRSSEVIDMMQAMNTGHPGSMSTLHANSTIEALQRLEILSLLGVSNLNSDAIRKWICSSVDLIVQLSRNEKGERFVSEIMDVKMLDKKSHLSRLYQR